MKKQIRNVRTIAGLALAAIVLFAGAEDAFAQRSRTGSRGSTKVERSRSSKGKATTRSSGRSSSTRSSGRTGSSSRGRVESRSTGSRAGSSSSRGRVESRSAGSRVENRSGSRGSTSGRVEARNDRTRGGNRVGDSRSGSRSRNTIEGRGGNRSVSRGQPNRAGRRVVIPSRRWEYRRPVGHHVRYYTPTYLRLHRPRIHVHIHWPWTIRYRRHWRPRYRYRQVIRIETVVYGKRNYADVEVETVYSHRVRHATDEYAELDIEVERLELYHGGRYLGYVDQIPSSLRHIEATVYRDGEVYFDRELFLLGDPYAGFEMVSTRAYDGYVLDAYHHSHGYRAGRVDLRRHRVRTIRSSRLFRPSRFDGIVPISLLPSDEGWLWDYGADAISAAVDNYDWYYGSTRRESAPLSYGEPFRQEDRWEYTTSGGADIAFSRESRIQRVQ